MLNVLKQLGYISLAVLLGGCASRHGQTAALSTTTLPRLGHHHFEITTTSPEAQTAFDRGLTLAYSFQHYVAEQAYREDLVHFPDNGWSLLGLRDALHQQRRLAEARQVDARLKQVWQRADVAPAATCYCQDYR